MSRGYGKITIDLNDVASAIKELEQAKAWIIEGCDRLPKELAEEGGRVAEMVFHAIPTNEQGSPTEVSIEEAPNDYTIKAVGGSAAFIEFGTGVSTTPYPVESSDIHIGMDEYSKRNAQQFHERGYWFYGGQRYTGTYPYRPMMHAGKYIRDNIAKKAKEVFNQ